MKTPDEGRQPVVVGGGEQHQVRTWNGLGRRRHVRDELLDDQVRVRASRPEGTDARPARCSRRRRPGAGLALEDEGGVLERDVRIEIARMQARHQFAVSHLQQHLGQTGHPSGGLQMSDVRLDRPDRAVLPGQLAVRRALEGLAQPGDLDRIAERRPRAVRFHIAEGARIDPGLFQGRGDEVGLSIGVGNAIAVGLAAVVDATGPDHRINVIAVGDGPRPGLEQHGAHALARHIAVTRRGEALAASVFRSIAALGQPHVLERV